jgi:hypothetical protein
MEAYVQHVEKDFKGDRGFEIPDPTLKRRRLAITECDLKVRLFGRKDLSRNWNRCPRVSGSGWTWSRVTSLRCTKPSMQKGSGTNKS